MKNMKNWQTARRTEKERVFLCFRRAFPENTPHYSVIKRQASLLDMHVCIKTRYNPCRDNYNRESMSIVDVMPEQTHQGVHGHLSWEGATPLHKRLEGKVAIVTGGGRGIGEATVRLFEKHGAKVVIADIDATAGELLAASLSPSVTFCPCDVSEESDVKYLISFTVSRHGRVDIIFNNAGVLGNQANNKKSIMEFDPDEFDRVMRVNVRGVALGMKHAARAMIPWRSGCIISTASVAGVMGGLGPHAYTASKHAIVGLTKNAACELGAYGIRVNCISPFGVATNMLVGAWNTEDDQEQKDDVIMLRNPRSEEVEKMEEFIKSIATLRGPTLRPRDIAEAALYLASEESSYINGHNLVVDGGVTISRNCIGL